MLGNPGQAVHRAGRAPAVAAHHHDLYHPSVELLNSSVARFVEISWRWRAAIRVEDTESLWQQTITDEGCWRNGAARKRDPVWENVLTSGL